MTTEPAAPATEPAEVPECAPGTPLARLRQELPAPVQAIVTLSGELLREARDRPEAFREDLAKMHDAGVRLSDFARQTLSPGGEPAGGAGASDVSRVRHDLGNHLNRVSGY